MPGWYKDSVWKVIHKCLEVIWKVSGLCLNDQNVSKRFIGGVQGIFCRYFTSNRKIFGKFQELGTFCRVICGVKCLESV